MAGSQLLRAIGMQQAQRDHLAAETNANNARANFYNTRTPTEASDASLRQALVDAGNDGNDVDAAIAASRRGDRSGLKALFAAPPREPAPRILKTPTGYVGVGSTGVASPIVDGQGNTVRPPLPAPHAGRQPNPNAESPDHRNARQGMTAINEQINDDRGQLQAMDRNAPPLVKLPGIATGTAADSVQARDFTTRHASIQAHADSLRRVRDGLAGRLTGGAAAPAGASTGTSADGMASPSQTPGALPPMQPKDHSRAQSDPDYAAWLAKKGYKVQGSQP